MNTQQMLGMFSHISKQTMGLYEQETGTVTMFQLLPTEAKVKTCVDLLKLPGQTVKAIVVVNYLRTHSQYRMDYEAWAKSEELEEICNKERSRVKVRVGIFTQRKITIKKTA